ncbi:hypothetical protein EDD80_10348 [Anseongella ginsenosidimutans]|uniref:DUF1640 domain-containing protein n=1 Tax=Anseongella ginsenosidimutans TaxID=496056 RepID=A0A4R3KT61_9SPHI|nr:hypothetical protein [Anseongella ginsenosidimutans]QEC53311.1 hypothetical protein FRZ59_13835 [Anseongella ginsenosidimutans]TCS88187.1 hypothetical protein EDD80_10348 [Anseongella ginsenosidimutans]
MKIDFKLVDALKENFGENGARNFISLLEEKIKMIYQDKLATRNDIALLKSDIRQLEGNISLLKAEVKGDTTALKLEIANSYKSLLKWLISMLAPLYIALAGFIITLLIKIL